MLAPGRDGQLPEHGADALVGVGDVLVFLGQGPELLALRHRLLLLLLVGFHPQRGLYRALHIHALQRAADVGERPALLRLGATRLQQPGPELHELLPPDRGQVRAPQKPLARVGE